MERSTLFSNETYLELKQKKTTFQSFRFSSFSFNFCQTIGTVRGLECWNAYGMGKLVVLVSFRYEISSIGKGKMPRIDCKLSKNVKFLSFLMQYLYNFWEIAFNSINSTTKERALHNVFWRERCSVFFRNTSGWRRKKFQHWSQKVGKRSTKTKVIIQ